MSTLPTPKPKSVTINGQPYTLVAFYYPGSYTPWDTTYQAPFLGNFWVSPVTITASQHTETFKVSEAAFQATKWWDAMDNQGNPIRPQFAACATGDAAFRLRQRLAGDPKHGIVAQGPSADLTYAGLGRDGAMAVVLASKFQDPDLKAGLLATGGAYLLEHNAVAGRDQYWSDNCDGSGSNALGLALMTLRASLGGQGAPAPAQLVSEFTKRV